MYLLSLYKEIKRGVGVEILNIFWPPYRIALGSRTTHNCARLQTGSTTTWHNQQPKYTQESPPQKGKVNDYNFGFKVLVKMVYEYSEG